MSAMCLEVVLVRSPPKQFRAQIGPYACLREASHPQSFPQSPPPLTLQHLSPQVFHSLKDAKTTKFSQGRGRKGAKTRGKSSAQIASQTKLIKATEIILKRAVFCQVKFFLQCQQKNTASFTIFSGNNESTFPPIFPISPVIC